MAMTFRRIALAPAAILLLAAAAAAQTQPSLAGAAHPGGPDAGPAARPALPPGISYVDGQLRINVLGATLAEVLSKVAAITGAKIDVPAEASQEHMPVVELGPGSARQILGALLSDSNFDYLIQGSAADSGAVQSVVLLAREKKSATAVAADASTRPARSPYARAAASRQEEPPPPESNAPPPPESPAAETASAAPSPEPDAATAPRLSPALQALQAQGATEQLNGLRIAPMTPPTTLTQQSIGQQLQQMYQQRMQMQPTAAAAPAPGAK